MLKLPLALWYEPLVSVPIILRHDMLFERGIGFEFGQRFGRLLADCEEWSSLQKSMANAQHTRGSLFGHAGPIQTKKIS